MSITYSVTSNVNSMNTFIYTCVCARVCVELKKCSQLLRSAFSMIYRSPLCLFRYRPAEIVGTQMYETKRWARLDDASSLPAKALLRHQTMSSEWRKPRSKSEVGLPTRRVISADQLPCRKRPMSQTLPIYSSLQSLQLLIQNMIGIQRTSSYDIIKLLRQYNVTYLVMKTL